MSDTQSAVASAIQRTSKAPATLSGMKSQDIGNLLEKFKYQIQNALPKHLTPERVIQMAVTLATRNPDLQECTQQSFLGAVLQASILGFQPVQSLGECYFVPYYNKNIGKKEVQFQIGYKGWINLARRSNQILSIEAEVVYKQDFFEVKKGLYSELNHVPNLDHDYSDEDITFVYAVAKYKDGGYNFVVMSKRQIEKLRLRNPQQKEFPSGAWKTDYGKMAMAKVLKQLSSLLPTATEYQTMQVTDEKVLQIDNFNKGELKVEEIQEENTNFAEVQEAQVVESEDTKGSADTK